MRAVNSARLKHNPVEGQWRRSICQRMADIKSRMPKAVNAVREKLQPTPSRMINNRIDRNQIPSAIPTMREVIAIFASEDSPIAGAAINWTELANFVWTAMQPMVDPEVEGLKR